MKNHLNWPAIRSLLPLLWQFKGRVTITPASLLQAELTNVALLLALNSAVHALFTKLSYQTIHRIPVKMFHYLDKLLRPFLQ